MQNTFWVSQSVAGTLSPIQTRIKNEKKKKRNTNSYRTVTQTKCQHAFWSTQRTFFLIAVCRLVDTLLLSLARNNYDKQAEVLSSGLVNKLKTDWQNQTVQCQFNFIGISWNNYRKTKKKKENKNDVTWWDHTTSTDMTSVCCLLLIKKLIVSG